MTTPLPVERLQRRHFSQHPVWVFREDDSVQPLETLPAEGWGQYLLAARCTLQDGSELPGAVQLDQLGAKRSLTPAFVFLLDRQLPMQGQESSRLLARFTRSPGNRVRRWALVDCLPGESRPRQARVRHGVGLQLLGLALKLIWLRGQRRRS